MSRNKCFQEELELEQLRATEQDLLKRKKESEENRRRLARERSEQERTMPPIPDVLERTRKIQHEINATRGEISNILRTERRSLVLLMLLVTATGTLIWWGVTLMQGG